MRLRITLVRPGYRLPLAPTAATRDEVAAIVREAKRWLNAKWQGAEVEVTEEQT